jgi:cell wall-associated NlpC family hydrolase
MRERLGTLILTRVTRSGKATRGLLAVSTAAVVLVAGAAILRANDGDDSGSDRPGSAPAANGAAALIQDSEEAQGFPEPDSSRSHELAEAPLEAAANSPAAADTGPSPGAPSDAEVRRDLRRLERYRRRARAGGAVQATSDGIAVDPIGAPPAISDVISGGNAIADFPYRLGGGHGSFVDDAYDCSGSVSYALAAAGLLAEPVTSAEFMRWGRPGPGRWLTVYANHGHVYMTVGGLRFDTSGRAGRRGSRWQPAQRSSRGFAARHWPGL